MRGLFQCLLTAEQIRCPAVGIYLGTSSPEQGDGEAGTRDRGTQGVASTPRSLLDLQGVHFQSDLLMNES